MTARNPRPGHFSATPAGGFRRQYHQNDHQNVAARQEQGLGFCSGDGSSSSSVSSSINNSRHMTGRGMGSPSRPQRRSGLRPGGGRNARSRAFLGGGVLGGLTALFSASSSSSSSRSGGGYSDVEGDVEGGGESHQREATAAGTVSDASSPSTTVAAAAAATTTTAATSGGGVWGGASSSAGDGGDRSGAVDAGAGENGREAVAAVGPGVSWATLAAVVASQVAFVGLFGWISSSTIRQQVFSSFSASPEAAALGVVGMLPLLAYGLALDLRKDHWDWVRKIDEATSEVALQLFGSERQVAKVTAVVIPLAILIGFCEECAFRGLLPLFIAAKTGLPTAAVVALSGVIFGSLHAATLAYFVTATVSGVFFHGLLLFSGNIFVPIVAHAVYDAIALVRYHVKVTSRKQK
eukprot:g1505.t2